MSRERARLIIAALAVGLASVLLFFGKIDTALYSAIVFTVLGYYFGRVEARVEARRSGG